jgi:inosose dehydratase
MNNLEKKSGSEFTQEQNSKPAPLFDPQKVFLGITPTGWCNSDDAFIDLVPPIPYQQILSEMALTGFKGCQGAPKFPSDITVLKEELAMRNLTICEPWVGTYFTIGDKEDTRKIFYQQMEYMKSIGGSNVIVVAELGGAVHQQPIYPLANKPILNDKQWELLSTGLNEIGKIATENGMLLCYHPHIGTAVETFDEIDRLMNSTNPEYLHLLLDTGHLYYAGVDPLQVAKKYATRIKHLHLKNIRQQKLQESKEQKLSFLDSIKSGIFTVPGDKEGIIDFDAVFKVLAANDYEGWLVVEAEQDPNKANPLKYAKIAQAFLSDYMKLAVTSTVQANDYVMNN